MKVIIRRAWNSSTLTWILATGAIIGCMMLVMSTLSTIGGIANPVDPVSVTENNPARWLFYVGCILGLPSAVLLAMRSIANYG